MLQIEFRRDLTFWIESDRRVAIRVMRLVDEVMRDPFHGTGKPELLKHTFRGHWSRRLTTEHRIVYEVTHTVTRFTLARFHYTR